LGISRLSEEGSEFGRKCPLGVVVVAEVGHVEREAAIGIAVDQLLDLLYIFRLTKGSHAHHLVLALIDLESKEGSKGGVEEPERMRKTDLFS
jgi:hypothetical protein